MIKAVLLLLLATAILGASTRKPRVKTDGKKFGGKLPSQMKIGKGTGRAALAVGAAGLLTAGMIGLPLWMIKQLPKPDFQSSDMEDDHAGDDHGHDHGDEGDDHDISNGRCTSDYSDPNTGLIYYCDFSSGRYYTQDKITGETHWYQEKDDHHSNTNGGCTTDRYDPNTGTTYYCDASSGWYFYYDQFTGERHWYGA